MTLRKTVKIAFGKATLCYRYTNDAGFVSLTEIPPLDEPAVAIDMYSSLSQIHNAFIEPFFLLQSFLPFIEEFKQFDIAKIILMCAAAHAQLPNDYKGDSEHVSQFKADFQAELPLIDMKLSDVNIDLDHCSRKEYRNFYQAARQYDLVGDKQSFAPVMINHVYISNLRKHGFFAASSGTTTTVVDSTNTLQLEG